MNDMDQSLMDVVVDPGRPRAYPNFATELSHIPGKSGFFAVLSTAVGMNREGIDYFLKQRTIHGDVYRGQVGAHQAIIVSDPDLIGKILRNEDRAWSSGMAIGKITEGLTLDVPAYKRRYLLGLDFEHHLGARKLLQYAFSKTAQRGYLSIIRKSFSEDVEKWRARDVISFKRDIKHILSKLSARLFLGLYDESESNSVLNVTDAFWAALMSLVKNPALNPKRKRAIKLKRDLRHETSLLIPSRRQTPGPDLLSYLCNLEEKPDDWDDEQLIDLLFGVVLPSFDTTALGLSSMFYLLATHHQWQDRVRSEALSLPDDFGLEDLQKMEATEWVWKETLRIYPVSAAVQRAALRTVTLGGYRIPAATLVVLSIGQLGFLPQYWNDPKRFDPERFSPARQEDKNHKYIYMPFGHGPHVCIGAQLSTIEMKVLCALVLKRFRIELEKPYEGKHQLSPLGSVCGKVNLKLNAL